MMQFHISAHAELVAETRDRTGDLQIFSLTLSQLSYSGCYYLEMDKQNLSDVKLKKTAATGDRTWDLQIFSLTLSQLSYSGQLHLEVLTVLLIF